MEFLPQDIRYALRFLVRNKLFATVVILTLALGIGANTAIFGVVNAALLRQLPLGDPDRLVALWDLYPQSMGTEKFTVALPNFQEWESCKPALQRPGAWIPGTAVTFYTDRSRFLA